LLVLSAKDRLPVRWAYDASVAVKVLLIDPSSKSVSFVTGFRVARDATP
jgi:hypothetical protein